MTTAGPLASRIRYRYERKFLVTALTTRELETAVSLHPSMFREEYPPRFVNSLYLDSLGRRHFNDNVAGIADRVKVRVRWYGRLFGPIEGPVLEVKIKAGLKGAKESYRLAAFEYERGFSDGDLRHTLASSSLPDPMRLRLSGLEGALIVRYWRKYFRSACSEYRITIDSQVRFREPDGHGSELLGSGNSSLGTVVELEYAEERDPEAAQITNCFPFRMTRNSKYVVGLESLNHWRT